MMLTYRHPIFYASSIFYTLEWAGVVSFNDISVIRYSRREFMFIDVWDNARGHLTPPYPSVVLDRDVHLSIPKNTIDKFVIEVTEDTDIDSDLSVGFASDNDLLAMRVIAF